MRNDFLPFSKPSITEADIAAVADVLRSGWITTGPRTKLLERRLAAYIETGKNDVDCTAPENAAILKSVLGGEDRGAARSIVLLNAAAAIRVAGKAKDLREGILLAALSIDSGAAMKKLDALIQESRS